MEECEIEESQLRLLSENRREREGDLHFRSASDKNSPNLDTERISNSKGFLLIDEDERLRIKSAPELAEKLQCSSSQSVKVVSIFGNTGDGKSHTLNHTFFQGESVFRTSSSQQSCTIGVWVAFDGTHNSLIMDTEGMLGVSSNVNQRTRLLLKVLAISDVVIYRTRADRLHNDMFRFLSESSKAYVTYFAQELEEAAQRGQIDAGMASLLPACVVFHETQHTDILGETEDSAKHSSEWTEQSPDEGHTEREQRAVDELRERCAKLNLPSLQFSSLHYVGTRTRKPPTDFSHLQQTIGALLKDRSVRSPRSLGAVLHIMEHFNKKFSGEVPQTVPEMFPDEYFTCRTICQACKKRCQLSMNHVKDGTKHMQQSQCKHHASLDNKILICRKCKLNGEAVQVVEKMASSSDSFLSGLAKYAWSGFVLECDRCGIIYRSRQNWLGNKEPTEQAACIELCHVWPGETAMIGAGTQNAGRRLLEGVTATAEAVRDVSAAPAQVVSAWLADKVAPSYWVPNSEIVTCHQCNHTFTIDDTKHHCRACGYGFCDACSSKRMFVGWRGWSASKVRVCDACFALSEKDQQAEAHAQSGLQPDVTSRKVGEVVVGAAEALVSGLQYPKSVVRDAVRPGYWEADADITNCAVCQVKISSHSIHHCRACGKGVCAACSSKRERVPLRGWDMPVRVCDDCTN